MTLLSCITKATEEAYNVGGKYVIVRREDLAYKPPLPPNAKMSALYEIVKREAVHYKTMVLFAKKQQGTGYAIGFPYICKEFGVRSIITYPGTDRQGLPSWYDTLIGRDEIQFRAIRLHPNMVSINVNESKKVAEQNNGYFIPFGFDDIASVEIHSRNFDIPKEVKTVIMATMTGMTLAGALLNVQRREVANLPGANINFPKFVGVSCGRPPENIIKAMHKYIVLPPEGYLTVINPYDRNFKPPKFDCPFPLHPDYELKAWYWLTQNIKTLEEPIYFINVGA